MSTHSISSAAAASRVSDGHLLEWLSELWSPFGSPKYYGRYCNKTHKGTIILTTSHLGDLAEVHIPSPESICQAVARCQASKTYIYISIYLPIYPYICIYIYRDVTNEEMNKYIYIYIYVHLHNAQISADA